MLLPILKSSSLRKLILPEDSEKAFEVSVEPREVAPPPGISSFCSSLVKSDVGASSASIPSSLPVAKVVAAPASNGRHAPNTSAPPSQSLAWLDGARGD